MTRIALIAGLASTLVLAMTAVSAQAEPFRHDGANVVHNSRPVIAHPMQIYRRPVIAHSMQIYRRPHHNRHVWRGWR